ncbi:MAG: FAD:protein FMN transferase [Sedimentisphaerales bacterium]|nr:FAD:protein FMN transferase [Sedimentisphaerales bacterium]
MERDRHRRIGRAGPYAVYPYAVCRHRPDGRTRHFFGQTTSGGVRGLIGGIGLILLFFLLVPAGCKRQPDAGGSAHPAGEATTAGGGEQNGFSVDSGDMLVLGTFGRIRLRAEDESAGRQALERARALLERLEGQLSTYRPDSELSRVNQLAGRGPEPISEDTYQLLRLALDYGRITAGAFDCTVPPLLELWRQAEQRDRPPERAELDQALARVGYGKVLLPAGPPYTVSFQTAGMQVDVDGIGKGYIVDRVLESLRHSGARAGLVDIGGEVAAFGQRHPGTDWLVGIQDPFAADREDPFHQRPRWVIRLRDRAVATSGNYRQYYSIAGRRYSHILDPRTAEPVDALCSVTIIAPTAAGADALATAVSVLGVEAGKALIESLADTEALLIAGDADNPRPLRTSGFDRYEYIP